jgi:mucin-19
MPEVHPIYGNDVIFGDDGIISFSNSIWDWVNPTWYAEYGAPLLSVTSTDLGNGGNDTIIGGPNNQVVVGGAGADKITVSNATDVVIGDNGAVTWLNGGAFSEIQTTDVTQAQTGSDTIVAGNGEDYILGGAGNDSITSGTGDSAIIGDEGAMFFVTWCQRPQDNPNWISFQDAILYEMNSATPNLLGSNTITVGSGQNAIIGGSGSNTITTGNGGNTVVGGNGYVSFLAPGVDGTVETIDTSYDGNNKISTGTGNDRILGGSGTNAITDTGGSNVIFGGDGVLTFVDDNIEGDSALLAFSGLTTAGAGDWTLYTDGQLVSAVSTDTTKDGNDTIVAGDGQNLIVGGTGSNTITAGNGQDIVVNGNAEIGFAGTGELQQVQSTAPVPTPGATTNSITVGNGNDIIIGGIGTNTITAGNGADIVFGADGNVIFTNFVRTTIEGQPWDTVEDTVVSRAQSTYLSLGGNNTITVGSGNDVVMGGPGNDTITTGGTMAPAGQTTGGSSYVIFGGDGQVVFSPGGWVTSATLVFPQLTGTDIVTIGSSPSLLLQGADDEEISGLQTPTPQMASGPAPTGQDTSPGLVESQLQPIVVEAEAIWAKVLGPDNARLAILNGITVQVGDLPGGLIGGTIGDTIYIDSTADGWGWFIDPTAAGDAEFTATATPGVLTALPGTAASGHMDLLSTVLHELGNAMGFPEDSGQDVTGNVLAPGVRRLPVLEGDVGVASGVPVIDWSAYNDVSQDTMAQFDVDGSSWVDGFLNNLGQNGKHHRPNAGLRIKPPGT